MAFKLEVETDGAAFADEAHDLELARIIEDVAKRVVGGSAEGHVRDLNGNTCGYFHMEDD